MNTYEIQQGTENEELIRQINFVVEQVNTLKQKELYELYPYFFFSVFIKFQNFIYNMFEKYSLGQNSTKGYKPSLKHNFQDEKELHSFLGTKKKDYIEYDEKIDLLSSYIFDPDIFFQLSMLQPIPYSQLIAIRNYIAHESNHSKNKLEQLKIIDSTTTLSDYFIKKKKGTSKSHFELIIENLKDFSDYAING